MSKDKIEEELMLLERNGRLTPAAVVEAARDPDSPLHAHFDWDDNSAAESHRLNQARHLIRSVRIQVSINNVPVTVNRYVRDPGADAREAGYVQVIKLKSEHDYARDAVLEEMSRVKACIKRAKSIAAVLGTTDDMDEIDHLAGSIIHRLEEEAATTMA